MSETLNPEDIFERGKHQWLMARHGLNELAKGLGAVASKLTKQDVMTGSGDAQSQSRVDAFVAFVDRETDKFGAYFDVDKEEDKFKAFKLVLGEHSLLTEATSPTEETYFLCDGTMLHASYDPTEHGVLYYGDRSVIEEA